MILLAIYIYTVTHNIPFKSMQHLFEKQPSRHTAVLVKEYGRVWCDLSCCTKGNPFIYTTIPLKEGDVSVIKRNAWNCHLKKYSVPCRKYSIILKGYSSISSCSFRDHSAACLYASFLEKDAIYLFIPLKRGYFERVFLNKQLHFKGPWHSLRTVQHAFMQQYICSFL